MQGVKTYKIWNRRLARPKITTLHIKVNSGLSNTNKLLLLKYSFNASLIFFNFVTLTTPQNFSDSMILSLLTSFLAYSNMRCSNLIPKESIFLVIPSDKTLLRTKLCRVATGFDNILCRSQ